MNKKESKAAAGVVTPIIEPVSKGTETITPHEEVMSIEQYKETYVAKFDHNKAHIKKLGDKLKKVNIEGIADKKNYELVKSIKSDIATALRITEDRRVSLKEPHLRRGQAIDGYAKELEAPLRELKTLADAKLKAIDDAKEVEKKRKETEAAELLDNRVNELKEAGLAFDGSYYAIGNISTDLATIGKLNDKQYAGLLAAVIDAKAEEDRLKAEAEEKAAEEKRLLAEQQAEVLRKQQEQEQKERELNERMAEIERKEKEAKAREIQARQRLLQEAGLSYIVMDGIYKLDTPSGMLSITHADVEVLDEQEWQTRIEAISKLSREIATKEDQRKKELEAIQTRTRQREAQLIALGLVFDSSSLMVFHDPTTGKEISIKSFKIENSGEDTWRKIIDEISTDIQNISNEAAQILEEKAKILEVERFAGLSDQQKVEEYLQKFVFIIAPDLALETNKEALLEFKFALEDSANKLLDAVKLN